MRIYEQFQKSLSAKENAGFLKNEYGIGGSSHAGDSDKYSQWHDAKGLCIYDKYRDGSQKLLLKWNQVAERIGELIRMDRYLSPKEKEKYPEWLAETEIKRAEVELLKRNREILSTAPIEKYFDIDSFIGKEVRIDDHLFVIESVGKISGDVSMRDVTLQNEMGFPILRMCPLRRSEKSL